MVTWGILLGLLTAVFLELDGHMRVWVVYFLRCCCSVFLFLFLFCQFLLGSKSCQGLTDQRCWVTFTRSHSWLEGRIA